MSSLLKRGATLALTKRILLARRTPRLRDHYSDCQLIESETQLCALHENDVYAMATPDEATLQNLQKCGLTKRGATLFLEQQTHLLDGKERLYKQVANYLCIKSQF